MKSQHKILDKKYDNYVEHPRYGRRPRFTGLNPNPFDEGVQLHSNATTIHEIQKRAKNVFGKKLGFLTDLEKIMPKEPARISRTAIKAESNLQNQPTVPVTHYFDVERICRDCKKSFIFFAEEQKHWYERLRFPLEADCVRCPRCRKKEQFLAGNRAKYERLCAMKKRDWKADLQMACCALTLVENGIFGNKVIQSIRALIKTVPQTERMEISYLDLKARLKLLAKQT